MPNRERDHLVNDRRIRKWKNKLTAAQGPLFVHVATHGFLRTSRALESRRARSWRNERDIVAAPNLVSSHDDRPGIEDALDDAGLFFADASDDHGTLTAREIAGIDLRGTQLVVLSACDTGVGDVAHSEGVYGLRRALAIAGAQTQVVSLWRVDDDATSQLMDRYYAGLRNGMGRSEALRQAQLSLLNDGRHAHPFYWAAFVPIGDERPLRAHPAFCRRGECSRARDPHYRLAEVSLVPSTGGLYPGAMSRPPTWAYCESEARHRHRWADQY